MIKSILAPLALFLCSCSSTDEEVPTAPAFTLFHVDFGQRVIVGDDNNEEGTE